MRTIYIKVPVSEHPPKRGWYDTDKGNLFWYELESEWSCRDDRVSSEYPTYWLKETELPSEEEVIKYSRQTGIGEIEKNGIYVGCNYILSKIFKTK